MNARLSIVLTMLLLPLTGCEHKRAADADNEVDGADGRPAVRYLSVDMQAGTTQFGPVLTVEIELEARASMRLNAPHVKVMARCDGSSDDDDAFFSDLSHAEPGDRKVDVVTLFDHGGLSAPPKKCQLTLSLTEGSTAPRRWCFEGGRTSPGKC